MSGLVNSREKQLCEYCKNLLITEHIKEILESLAKLPSATPKLWVHAQKSPMVFDMSTQMGGIPGELHSKKEIFLWYLLTPPVFLMTMCTPGLEDSRDVTDLEAN